MSYFAIASPNRPKTVSLLCSGTEADFLVLNGGWRGSFRNGVVTIAHNGTRFPAIIVWRGDLKAAEANRFEDVMDAIEAQLEKAA